jgi:serine/threonine protein kinase
VEIFETMNCAQRQKTGSIYPLPSNSEYRKQQEEMIVFEKANPSKDYDILDELGVGGFGKVYRCVRNEDQEVFAMKHIDIKDSGVE